MGTLSMCRICLVEDVSMYEVANKDLQDMYEKLTDIPFFLQFVTGDCRPMLACFFCYTKLKQCCQLLRKCLKAEEVFAQMLNGDYEQIPLEFQGEIEFYGGFTLSPMQHMSIDDVCQISSLSDAISEQLPAVCDTEDDIELKEECLSDELEAEYPEDSCVDQEDMPSHHAESDSEDDVPLMKIKIEVKEEVPEEETRAPVAKRPKLDIRNGKLQDTITDKQKKNGPADWKIVHSTRMKTSKSVSKFRVPIISDSIAKPRVNNSILNDDKEIIEKSLKKEIVQEVLNTAKNMNYHYNSNQDHFECKIFNDKCMNNSDDVNMHKQICKSYTCDICQRSFNIKSKLISHIRTHTGEKPYKCDICQRSFTQKGDLKIHIRLHTGEKPYKCDICQRSFTRKGDLKIHIRLHTGEKPYKCDICQRSFTRKGDLKIHIRLHTGEKPYKCDICQRSFSNHSHLKRHTRIHTGEKPYKCDICQRSFSNLGHLNRHTRIHTGEKPYKCDICQRSFNNHSNLNRHIRIHTCEKPYKCDICQRSFTQKGYLKLHIATHTGEKPYKCDICQQSFTKNKHLISHIRVHTGEKPFKCDICQRSFTRKGDLKSHIRTHTGEKPYKCDICQRSFTRKAYLKLHIRKHTGEKPYKCDMSAECYSKRRFEITYSHTHW